jgi:hypothetical protein
VLARLEVIANVFADGLPELLGSHLFHQPHEPGLLPVRHPLTIVPAQVISHQQAKVWGEQSSAS